MTAWYEKPYPKNPHPPSVKLPREVNVGDQGDDVIAYKRAISRAGRWPWTTFDDYYSNDFAHGTSGKVGDTGVEGIQRQSGLPDDGVMGSKTFEILRTSLVPKGLANEGQPLFDSYSLNLLKGYAPPKPVTPVGEKALVDYAKRCMANEPKIHYSQNRPMTHLGKDPAAGFVCDCSGHATSCYYEAEWPDPNHSGYNGYGWTGTLVANPKVSSPFKVGDMALYGTSESNTTHVTTCYIAGDPHASVWVSHGSEAGPYATALFYRDDLVCVVRPAK